MKKQIIMIALLFGVSRLLAYNFVIPSEVKPNSQTTVVLPPNYKWSFFSSNPKNLAVNVPKSVINPTSIIIKVLAELTPSNKEGHSLIMIGVGVGPNLDTLLSSGVRKIKVTNSSQAVVAKPVVAKSVTAKPVVAKSVTAKTVTPSAVIVAKSVAPPVVAKSAVAKSVVVTPPCKYISLHGRGNANGGKGLKAEWGQTAEQIAVTQCPRVCKYSGGDYKYSKKNSAGKLFIMGSSDTSQCWCCKSK
jgi:hypothetical protein